MIIREQKIRKKIRSLLVREAALKNRSLIELLQEGKVSDAIKKAEKFFSGSEEEKIFFQEDVVKWINNVLRVTSTNRKEHLIVPIFLNLVTKNNQLKPGEYLSQDYKSYLYDLKGIFPCVAKFLASGQLDKNKLENSAASGLKEFYLYVVSVIGRIPTGNQCVDAEGRSGAHNTAVFTPISFNDKDFRDIFISYMPRIAKQEKKKRTITGEKTSIVYDSDGIMVVRPESVNASCYFGQMGAWCIARPDNGMFASYETGDDKRYFYFLRNFKNLPNAMQSDVVIQFIWKPGDKKYQGYWTADDKFVMANPSNSYKTVQGVPQLQNSNALRKIDFMNDKFDLPISYENTPSFTFFVAHLRTSGPFAHEAGLPLTEGVSYKVALEILKHLITTQRFQTFITQDQKDALAVAGLPPEEAAALKQKIAQKRQERQEASKKIIEKIINTNENNISLPGSLVAQIKRIKTKTMSLHEEKERIMSRCKNLLDEFSLYLSDTDRIDVIDTITTENKSFFKTAFVDFEGDPKVAERIKIILRSKLYKLITEFTSQLENSVLLEKPDKSDIDAKQRRLSKINSMESSLVKDLTSEIISAFNGEKDLDRMIEIIYLRSIDLIRHVYIEDETFEKLYYEDLNYPQRLIESVTDLFMPGIVKIVSDIALKGIQLNASYIHADDPPVLKGKKSIVFGENAAILLKRIHTYLNTLKNNENYQTILNQITTKSLPEINKFKKETEESFNIAKNSVAQLAKTKLGNVPINKNFNVNKNTNNTSIDLRLNLNIPSFEEINQNISIDNNSSDIVFDGIKNSILKEIKTNISKVVFDKKYSYEGDELLYLEGISDFVNNDLIVIIDRSKNNVVDLFIDDRRALNMKGIQINSAENIIYLTNNVSVNADNKDQLVIKQLQRILEKEQFGSLKITGKITYKVPVFPNDPTLSMPNLNVSHVAILSEEADGVFEEVADEYGVEDIEYLYKDALGDPLFDLQYETILSCVENILEMYNISFSINGLINDLVSDYETKKLSGRELELPPGVYRDIFTEININDSHEIIPFAEYADDVEDIIDMYQNNIQPVLNQQRTHYLITTNIDLGLDVNSFIMAAINNIDDENIIPLLNLIVEDLNLLLQDIIPEYANLVIRAAQNNVQKYHSNVLPKIANIINQQGIDASTFRDLLRQEAIELAMEQY